MRAYVIGSLRRGILPALVGLTLSCAWSAETGPFSGTPEGMILASGDNRVVLLKPSGEVAWEYRTALTHDAWMLPNGNVLLADGNGVREVTPEKQVVFQYTPEKSQGGGAYACQRLANGNTLVGENGTGRVLEVDPAGKVLFALQTAPYKEGAHHNMRLARKLANGNYLVCQSGAHVVKEYRPNGEVVREFPVPDVAFAAIRTPRGTTFVASLGRITEFDAEGKSVWEFNRTDAAGLTITNLTGMHLLPNGNLAVGCYAAYNAQGQGVGLLEITHDKKVAWSFADPRFARSMMAVQVLDPQAKPLPGECLR